MVLDGLCREINFNLDKMCWKTPNGARVEPCYNSVLVPLPCEKTTIEFLSYFFFGCVLRDGITHFGNPETEVDGFAGSFLDEE